jgi:hypothetical protein
MLKNKNIWIIVGLIVIGGSFAAVYANNQVVRRTVSGSGTAEAVQEKAAEIEHWKSCINNEFGYSVSYPADWHTYGKESYSETTLYRESPCSGPRVLISPHRIEERVGTGSSAAVEIRYQTVAHLGVATYEGINSLEEYLARNPDLADTISSYQAIDLDGKRFIWIDRYPGDPTLISFENGLLTTIRASAEIPKPVFRAMLSTIRF